jgi:hypothetical protein
VSGGYIGDPPGKRPLDRRVSSALANAQRRVAVHQARQAEQVKAAQAKKPEPQVEVAVSKKRVQREG